MKLPRRQFLHLAAATAATAAMPPNAKAQIYPARPVRIIVGFALGGSADIIARLVAQWLSDRLGQQFVVENRPRAGTNISPQAVAEAVPDGYTLLLLQAAKFLNGTLYEKPSFNFIRPIAPVPSLTR